MESKALTRLAALRKLNAARDWVNSDLYRLLFKTDLYEVAYGKIKSSPGNMTAGVDGNTLDGFSYDVVGDIVASLRDESFQFKPARRVFIPKANGKMRPLGIASPRDKIVQEVMRMILEAIYDSPRGAYFHDGSHGFRPDRSCHTALEEFRFKWPGVNWIVEGDIKSCFDEIDHHTLISLLRRKIADGRFLNLIWKALRAGYLWQGERRDTLIGSPQGSIISPILANVYLHELDCFVEQLRQAHERGDMRRVNPEYIAISDKRKRLLKRSGGVWTREVKDLTVRMRDLPSKLLADPDFIRIKYLRYADDWILGVTGPKELATSLKDEIATFLKDRLKLELSREKTTEAEHRGGTARSSDERRVTRRERRGRVIRASPTESTAHAGGIHGWGKAVRYFQVACLAGLASGQSQSGGRRSRWRIDRRIRAEVEAQPLQDLESHVVGDLLSAAGPDGDNPEGRRPRADCGTQRWETGSLLGNRPSTPWVKPERGVGGTTGW